MSVGEEGGREGGVFECAICLEDLEEDKVRILRGCKHTLCSACLEQIASIRHGACVLLRVQQVFCWCFLAPSVRALAT